MVPRATVALTALAAVALLAAPAPAAPPSPVPPALAGVKACCSDPAQFRYQPLPASGNVDFDINKQSPAFEFQSGLSHFQAFALPALSKPYVIEIRSYISGGPDPLRARVLYPVAAILTDDFIVARAAGLEQLRAEIPIMEQATSPAYRLAIPFDPGASREKYLVVFTPSHLLAEHALPPFNDPESVAVAAREAFLGASPQGKLRITVRTVVGEMPPIESLLP
jgi:Maltose operon periplasmic protein precursor (MalM)